MQNNLERALKHHQAGRLKEAEAIYREVLARQPQHPQALHMLGVLALQREQYDDAAKLIGQAIASEPDYAEAHNNLGLVLQAQGRLQDAVAAYRRALETNPSLADAHSNLGLALLELGELAAALDAFKQAAQLQPHAAEAHYNIGNALARLTRMREAVAAYQEALALKPDYAEAYNNLGLAFLAQHHYGDAAGALERALSYAPYDPEYLSNLGSVLVQQREFTEAIARCRRAIELNPDFADAHNNLGSALRGMGDATAAAAAFRQAIAIRPDFAEAYYSLGDCLKSQTALGEAIGSFRQALALEPNAAGHSNLLFSMNYCTDVHPVDLFAEHQRWAHQYAAALEKTIQPTSNDAATDRRLRIGYLSPDFRGHSVAFFIEPILANHEREGFEVFCYANVSRTDAVTQRLQVLSDHWCDILRFSDEEVVAQIRKDKIDILVDLAGHSAHNRLLVFARKPAPVQVGYLGYPNTRGFTSIDYWLSDTFADPPGETERYYVEEIVRLPRGFNCYQPHPDSPAVGSLPSKREGHMTFCSFNNAAKINADVIACWAAILKALPESRLILKARSLADTDTRVRLQALFAEHDIAAERIELIAWLDSSTEHLQLYHRVDIALDTFPYNGHTTTCEALWMGVPVITLAGKMHAGRVGVSLLSHAGLPELIAESPEAYVEAAVGLAHDLKRLEALRAGLREQIQASALMDTAGFIGSLEAAYRGMWVRYCENRETRSGEQETS